MDNDQDLREELRTAQNRIKVLDDTLATFFAAPKVFATIVKVNDCVNPNNFAANDLVRIMVGPNEGKTARVCIGRDSHVVDPDGWVEVLMPDLSRGRYNIGISPIPPHIKLIGKGDGSSLIISHDGDCLEIEKPWGHDFVRGEMIKINEKTKQFVDWSPVFGSGEIVSVESHVDNEHIEVIVQGSRKVVLNAVAEEISAGDQIQLDSSGHVGLRRISNDLDAKYRFDGNLCVQWSDIGGCEEAKSSLRRLVVDPFEQKELYTFYGEETPHGALMYGPPGCGKTLLAKAAYTELLKRYGEVAMKTGWIYVKGPEILSKWVGNSEQAVRNLFARGERHWRKNNTPAILFIDEAEAIMPMRGSRHTSDITDTIVPTFLTEMDGLKESHTIVILATNRPEKLDSAITRHGRIDMHVKVPRPDMQNTLQLFKIYAKKLPLHETNLETVASMCAAEVFSKARTLYKVKEEIVIGGSKNYYDHIFSFKDMVNGAMIKSIVNLARTKARERDCASNKLLGVTVPDFQEAIEEIYKSQLGTSHEMDLYDFVEDRRISRCNLLVEKIRPE